MPTRLEDGRIVCTLENGVFQLIGSTWVECFTDFTVRDECEICNCFPTENLL